MKKLHRWERHLIKIKGRTTEIKLQPSCHTTCRKCELMIWYGTKQLKTKIQDREYSPFEKYEDIYRPHRCK